VGAFGHAPPPEDAYTYYIRGRKAAVEGKHHDAVRWFRAAVRLVPDDPSLRVALCEELIAAGDLDAAEQEITVLLERWPGDPDAWLVRGRLRSRRGDTAGAALAYEQAMALEPDGERAYLLAGAAREKLEEPEKAAAAYDALLRRWPDSVEGHYRRGVLAFDQRDYTLAEKHLGRAVELAPDFVEARVRLARTYQRLGQPAKAQSTLRDAFDRSGEDPWVGEQLFRVLLEGGDRDGALALLATLDADWRAPDVRVALGNLYLLLHHPDEALAIARAVLARAGTGTHHGARLLEARALAQKQDHAGATGAALAIPAGAPEWAEAQALAADQLERQGKTADARALLDAALAKAPDSVVLIVARARLEERAGDVDAARNILRDGQARLPGDRDLIYARASLEERAGNHERAVAIMRDEVLADEPDSVMALNFIGYSYAARGVNLDEAEKLLGRALELAPDDGYVLDSWGVLMIARGRYDQAQAALERADALAPDEPEILLHLGEVVEKRGDARRAKTLWKRALGLDPDEITRKRLEERMDALGAVR
jgi:tetratricopeptide (TPR) repeat protein